MSDLSDNTEHETWGALTSAPLDFIMKDRWVFPQSNGKLFGYYVAVLKYGIQTEIFAFQSTSDLSDNESEFRLHATAIYEAKLTFRNHLKS